jgi:hypothetical protein
MMNVISEKKKRRAIRFHRASRETAISYWSNRSRYVVVFTLAVDDFQRFPAPEMLCRIRGKRRGPRGEIVWRPDRRSMRRGKTQTDPNCCIWLAQSDNRQKEAEKVYRLGASKPELELEPRL